MQHFCYVTITFYSEPLKYFRLLRKQFPEKSLAEICQVRDEWEVLHPHTPLKLCPWLCQLSQIITGLWGRPGGLKIQQKSSLITMQKKT